MKLHCTYLAHRQIPQRRAARRVCQHLQFNRTYGILNKSFPLTAGTLGLTLDDLKESSHSHRPHWTKAVVSYAKEYFSGYVVETDEAAIVFFLRAAGFDSELCEDVADWLHQCERMGTLAEVLAMYKPVHSVRVVTAAEKIIPKKILSALRIWKKKGYISHDLFEKVLEVLRTTDPRDWDDDDVKFFLTDLIENVRNTLGDSLTDATLNSTNTGRKLRNNPHH